MEIRLKEDLKSHNFRNGAISPIKVTLFFSIEEKSASCTPLDLGPQHCFLLIFREKVNVRSEEVDNRGGKESIGLGCGDITSSNWPSEKKEKEGYNFRPNFYS
ncbi:hypothetical protein TNCT_733531 [Trichonephila clavata]|uniref:Uncharacterized protein n=1 Tax=Trichonephila clavata TaxID=2740835 RepID=A0A8X6F334_TRICU|nr:hypothetical protein TNCT_733531 [Trichonephila clavata]